MSELSKLYGRENLKQRDTVNITVRAPETNIVSQALGTVFLISMPNTPELCLSSYR